MRSSSRTSSAPASCTRPAPEWVELALAHQDAESVAVALRPTAGDEWEGVAASPQVPTA
jgi:hypothetical protein